MKITYYVLFFSKQIVLDHVNIRVCLGWKCINIMLYIYLYIKNIYISGYQIRYCANGGKCAKGDE